MNPYADPHFAEPHWLWLAVLGPILLFILHRYSTWARRRQLAQIAAPEITADLTRSHSPLRRGLKHFLLIVAVAGLGLALARPQWGELENSGQSLGHDMLFVLDCSRSMLASDIPPSRLQRAKLAIMDLVHRQGPGRLGLVAFAGQAFLQCPLTYDANAFEDTLMMVDDKTIPIPGTDIGGALEEAGRALDKDDRQKIVILLTDGEDLEKGGIKAAEELAKRGVIVFTLGVGTAAGAEIRVTNERGQTELLRNNKGEIVRSRLDEPTLTAIARATHGEYFPLGSLGEGLAKVRLAMDAIDASRPAAPAKKLGIDRFYWPLAILLLLLVLESLLGTRRSHSPPVPSLEPNRAT